MLIFRPWELCRVLDLCPQAILSIIHDHSTTFAPTKNLITSFSPTTLFILLKFIVLSMFLLKYLSTTNKVFARLGHNCLIIKRWLSDFGRIKHWSTYSLSRGSGKNFAVKILQYFQHFPIKNNLPKKFKVLYVKTTKCP